MKCTVRAALPEDMRAVFEISNDEQVRAASLTPRRIGWEEHVTWFLGKLADPSHVFYVVVDEKGTLAGQVRYAIAKEAATVSISLSASSRGHGLGRWSLTECDARLFAEHPEIQAIHGYIRVENEASSRTFASAGYLRAGRQSVKTDVGEVWRYEKKRS